MLEVEIFDFNKAVTSYIAFLEKLILQIDDSAIAKPDSQITSKPLLALYRAYNGLHIFFDRKATFIRRNLDKLNRIEDMSRDIFFGKSKEALINICINPNSHLESFFHDFRLSYVKDLLGHALLKSISQESYERLEFLLLKLFNTALYDITLHLLGNSDIGRVLDINETHDSSVLDLNQNPNFFLRPDFASRLDEFNDRKESKKIPEKSERLEIISLRQISELQEFSEFAYSVVTAIPQLSKACTVFNKLQRIFLNDNQFLIGAENPSKSYSDQVNNNQKIQLSKIFLVFNILTSSTIEISDSLTTSQAFENLLNTHQEIVVSLSDLDRQVLVKMLIFNFIHKSKQSDTDTINLHEIIKITQKLFGFSENKIKEAEMIVWQNYLLCLKNRTATDTEGHIKEEKKENELSLSEKDYSLSIPEGVPNFALLEIYLPGGKNNVGRLKIPYVTENQDFYYQHWLKTSGLKDFIDTQILNKLNLENNPEIDTVEFHLIFPDGSLEVTSTDNSKIGVSTDFPIIKYEITLNGRHINVGVKMYLIDHHSRVGDKLERDAACLQVLKKFKEITISKNTKVSSVAGAVFEETRATDTDLGTSNSDIYYRFTDPEWFEKRIKEITIVNELINKIDIYNGAPLFENPPPINKYTSKVLLLQALLIPKTAYLTVNRGQVAGLHSKEILDFDKKIFRHFVDFIAQRFPDINTYEDLVVNFYGYNQETLNDNLIAYHKYLRTNHIEQREVADIISKFKIGFDESVKSEEADIKVFKINTNTEVKIAIYKSNERRDTRVEMREKNVAIYLLRKNARNITSLEKQNNTCGMLLPKENGNNVEYIKNTRLIKKLFTEFLDIIYSAMKGLPHKDNFFRGGQDCGTRDAGAGISEFLDNEPIVEIFVERLNCLLNSGLSLENITIKSICANVFIDENGVSNDDNMDKINGILSNNELNASLEF